MIKRSKAFPALILGFIFVLIFLFFAKDLLPSNISKLGFIIPVILIDIYLWSSIRPETKDQKNFLRLLIFVMFWFPFALFVGSYIISAIVPFKEWNSAFRTYYFAILIVAYISKLIPAILLIFSDFIRSIVFMVSKLSPKTDETIPTRLMPRSRFLKYVGLMGGGLVFSGLLAGMIKWVYDFKVQHIPVTLKDLPNAFKGFRIVQISDLHLGSWASSEPLEDAVQIINDLDPDIVVFTGDLVNYSTEEAFQFKDTLQKIKATNGVFAVLGNHDYGDYIRWNKPTDKARNMLDLYRFYKSLGWNLLNNSNVLIERDSQKIALIGVENWGSIMRFPRKGDIAKAKTGTEEVKVKILLSHDPTHWDKIISQTEKDINLTLSGHTHGAQFGFEKGNFRWSPAQYIYKQWAGLYQSADKEQFLYVNRGIGHIGYPGRIGILPEITLIELI
jgi:predicted MPP superfamily phosphohydrolase